MNVLQQDALTSNVALAGQVALSPSPCLRRVRKLKESGVIQSTLTVLSPAAVGLEIQALIQIKIERYAECDIARFENQVTAMAQVATCHAVTGATDYFLHFVAEDMPTYCLTSAPMGQISGIA